MQNKHDVIHIISVPKYMYICTYINIHTDIWNISLSSLRNTFFSLIVKKSRFFYFRYIHFPLIGSKSEPFGVESNPWIIKCLRDLPLLRHFFKIHCYVFYIRISERAQIFTNLVINCTCQVITSIINSFLFFIRSFIYLLSARCIRWILLSSFLIYVYIFFYVSIFIQFYCMCIRTCVSYCHS